MKVKQGFTATLSNQQSSKPDFSSVERGFRNRFFEVQEESIDLCEPPVKLTRSEKEIRPRDIIWAKYNTRSCYWPAYVKTVERSRFVRILFLNYNKFIKSERTFRYPIKSPKIMRYRDAERSVIISEGRVHCRSKDLRQKSKIGRELKSFEEAVKLADMYLAARNTYGFKDELEIFKFLSSGSFGKQSLLHESNQGETPTLRHLQRVNEDIRTGDIVWAKCNDRSCYRPAYVKAVDENDFVKVLFLSNSNFVKEDSTFEFHNKSSMIKRYCVKQRKEMISRGRAHCEAKDLCQNPEMNRELKRFENAVRLADKYLTAQGTFGFKDEREGLHFLSSGSFISYKSLQGSVHEASGKTIQKRIASSAVTAESDRLRGIVKHQPGS